MLPFWERYLYHSLFYLEERHIKEQKYRFILSSGFIVNVNDNLDN